MEGQNPQPNEDPTPRAKEVIARREQLDRVAEFLDRCALERLLDLETAII